jgi:hypothetical protein
VNARLAEKYPDIGIAGAVPRVGPTTPTCARRPFDAPVDPTEARN